MEDAFYEPEEPFAGYEELDACADELPLATEDQYPGAAIPVDEGQFYENHAEDINDPYYPFRSESEIYLASFLTKPQRISNSRGAELITALSNGTLGSHQGLMTVNEMHKALDVLSSCYGIK